MAEEGEGEEGKLTCVDHGPLNEGAVGKMAADASSASAANIIFPYNMEENRGRDIRTRDKFFRGNACEPGRD